MPICNPVFVVLISVVLQLRVCVRGDEGLCRDGENCSNYRNVVQHHFKSCDDWLTVNCPLYCNSCLTSHQQSTGYSNENLTSSETGNYVVSSASHPLLIAFSVIITVSAIVIAVTVGKRKKAMEIKHALLRATKREQLLSIYHSLRPWSRNRPLSVSTDTDGHVYLIMNEDTK